jgi:hypothetical protein
MPPKGGKPSLAPKGKAVVLSFDLFSDSKKPLKSSGIKGFFTSRLVAGAGFELLPPTIRSCIRCDSPPGCLRGALTGRLALAGPNPAVPRLSRRPMRSRFDMGPLRGSRSRTRPSPGGPPRSHSQVQIQPLPAFRADSCDPDLNWARCAVPGLAPGPPPEGLRDPTRRFKSCRPRLSRRLMRSRFELVPLCGPGLLRTRHLVASSTSHSQVQILRVRYGRTRKPEHLAPVICSIGSGGRI